MPSESALAVESHIDRCLPCHDLIAMVARSSVIAGVETGEPQDTTVAGAEGEQTSRAVGPDRFRPGRAVGRYQVLEELAHGAMGVVYAAYDPKLDRKVALKLLLSDQAELAPERQARLLREAQAMARLSHPNVLAVHDVGIFDGQVFVTIEYVEGVTLEQWLCSEPRSWQDIVAVFAQAGGGLTALHAAGIVHRDFKPSNVLVDHNDQVKVVDLGLAHASRSPDEPATTSEGSEPPLPALEDSQWTSLVACSGSQGLSQSLSTAGVLVGTPAYMSPEQHVAAKTDPRSDQFSFCVALFEALYGVRPFPGDTLDALSSAVANGSVSNPPSSRDVPGWVRPILDKGLSVEPAARHAGMADLLALLRRDPRAARHRWLLAAGGATALCLAVIAGGYALGADRDNVSVCTAGRARVGNVWGDRARAQLTTAFGQDRGQFCHHHRPASNCAPRCLHDRVGRCIPRNLRGHPCARRAERRAPRSPHDVPQLAPRRSPRASRGSCGR